MLGNIKTFSKSNAENKLFSILMPTWNNLPYLKLCLDSLRKNSHFPHQFIVAVNDGADGSLDWIREQPHIDYIHASENIGICCAMNACRKLIRTEYVVYANDDMYFLPGWDLSLKKEIDRIGHKSFMLSSTLIEPRGRDECLVSADYGVDVAGFREKELLDDYQDLMKRGDWSGSTSPPNIIHIDLWDLVGGFSLEFSPGMNSDPDLSKKLWQVGVRIFIGKGDSLVYHFAQKTTGRIKKNDGRKTFLMKWGLTSKTFKANHLKMGQAAVPILPDEDLSLPLRWLQRLKCLGVCLK
jgi:glycosyltransferase involved in cell wall biosynthesis